MKICFISDTHGQHDEVIIPEGVDTLICSGDISMNGYKHQVVDFLEWFSNIDVENKIFIAGNHDFYFDTNHPKSINYKSDNEDYLDIIPDNIIYLNESSVTIDGIKIWGSPVTPWFYNWAFNKNTDDLLNYWDIIPDDTDIIVTHGPPYSILDLCTDGTLAGCNSLMGRIYDIVPKISTFGHIHEGYGVKDIDIDGSVVKFINSSVLDHRYRLTNQPITIDL